MRMFLLLFILLFNGEILKAQPQITYKIVGVEAFLYYRDKGTFSENIIDNSEFALWNVIIGAGDAKGNSEETLVKILVEGSGQGQSNADNLILEVTVSAEKSVILKKQFQLGLFDFNRKNSYPILLYDTGCIELTITAKLIGKGGSSKMVKVIPFRCGE
jgi:hypothetical protein